MKVFPVVKNVSAPLATLSRFVITFCKLSTSSFSESASGPSFGVNSPRSFIKSTDNQLQEQLKQLHVTLLNLKVLTTHAKVLVDELAQRPNRVIFGGKPPNLTPEGEILKSSKPLPGAKP